MLPSTEWKRRYYKRPEQQKWYAGETISLGIGQGYNNFTMLQLASATATLVSGGERYKPRLVREIVDVVSGETRRVGQRRARAAALQARARRADPARAARRDAGGHLGARLRRRAVQQRRQDRHRAGGGHQGEREVQRVEDRGAPARPLAVHRRRAAAESRPWRWRWWWRTPASARTPRRPSRAASSTTCCWASTRARRTWPPSARASRARRSVRHGVRRTCRCPARRPSARPMPLRPHRRRCASPAAPRTSP